MGKKFEAKVSEKKKENVAELIKMIKESSSILLASIKNLPARQFQIIKKKLRGKAVIKVPKKSTIARALESSGVPAAINLKNYLKEDTAIIFSSLDAFKLSALLSENKSRAKAKIGQEVDEEVAVEPGPTELVPGPIISQLSGLGLKFAIEDGKIAIKEKKVILKQGQKVTEAAADLMSKLDIKPVSVGLEPVVACDIKEGKIYKDVKIDRNKTLEELKTSYSRALGFAVKIVYPCKETIKFLLGKAASHEKALSKFIKTSEPKASEGS